MIRPSAHYKRCIETYIAAKDTNRPHLMARAFTTGATLMMDVRTTAITFPDVVKGMKQIARTLVSDFAERYDNIYTVCLGNPPDDDRATAFQCAWFVAMSEKDTRRPRVGFGRYEWFFTETPRVGNDVPLVEKLVITIDEMIVLDADAADDLAERASRLPYPWCSRDRLAAVFSSQDWVSADRSNGAVLKSLFKERIDALR